MHPNEQIITDLYEAFSRKDYRSMQRLYHDEAVFNDEVFKDLNAREVKAMWEMLIKRGKDLEVDYNNIHADETGGTAEWTAVYSFSKKKRKVQNHIQAEFQFKDGKIYRHQDSFSFPRWSAQALGLTGKIFGRSSWLRKKVQLQARKGLDQFIENN